MRRPFSSPTGALALSTLVLAGWGGCRGDVEQQDLARGLAAAGAAPITELGAESRLAAGAAALDGPPVAAGIGARRLWVSEYVDFYASAISPDGRYVTEVDWTTGDLAVRDLATGQLHRLTDKGPWERSSDYARNARFSRDGRRIAYAWYDAATSDYEVHVLEFAVDQDGTPRGSDARVVYAGGGPQPASRVFDWASDDDVLIEIYRPDNTTALARLSLGTGTLRVLKSFAWGQDPGGVAVSPDGRFIAYDRNSDIYLLAADGRRETTLVEAPGHDVVLGWTPRDGALLFHRSESGDGSVWRLPMSNGLPASPAVPVRHNVLHPQPLGVARDALYYGLVVESPAYVTATIDFDRRRLATLATRFESPGVGTFRGLAWSPDGEHVIHDVHHPASPTTWIQLRAADGRLVREWKFDMWIMRTAFRWAPDGNSVIVPARDHRERPGFIRIDLGTGELAMLRRFELGGEAGKVFAISPDGRTLYFTRHAIRDGVLDESSADIVAHDLASGAERPIRRVRGHGNLTVSPDGKWLALATGTRPGGTTIHTTLQVVTSDGREARAVYRGAGASSPVSLEPDKPPVGSVVSCRCRVVGWSPDSRSILFLDLADAPPDADADAQLLRVSRDGGKVERIATIPGYGAGATLHPDGRTIAYRTGGWRGEIWVMEGMGAATRPQESAQEGGSR